MNVTMWYGKEKKRDEFMYNHYSKGYSELDEPVGTPLQTHVWSGMYWRKDYAQLINGKLVKNEKL
jgi:hypothetical protein